MNKTIINDLLNIKENKNIELIVTTKAYDYFSNDIRLNKLGNVITILDARSAAFFTLGKESVSMVKPIVVLCADELGSALTAITEAYYQQQELLIFVIDNTIIDYNIYHNFSEVIERNEEIKEVRQLLNNKFYKPVIIRYKYNDKFSSKFKINITDMIEGILSTCNKDYSLKIDLHNFEVNKLYNEANVKFELNKSGYGSISKLLGSAIANPKKRNYLLSEISMISRDINAIGIRGNKNNTCIIFICDEEDETFDNWFIDNMYKIYKVYEIEKLKEILKENEKSALAIAYYYKKGE